MRILFIGDIVGKPGRKTVKEILPGIIQHNSIDFVIANGENLANGAGITEKTAKEMFEAGVNVLTGGNHSLQRSEGHKFIDSCTRVLIPYNMSRKLLGRGYGIYEVKNTKVAVVNLIGQIFMGPYESPFYAVFDIMKEIEEYPIKIIDFHAEATSEKLSMFYLLSGRFSAIIGTHTHVQTNDERIVDGTAYITDVGMTGGLSGIIGVKRELFIKKMVDRLPVKFQPEERSLGLCGVIIDIDEASGKAYFIDKIKVRLERESGSS